MEYLRIEHINKSYGDKVLFKDLSLVINKGDKIALIARNGSGKTTLLQVIAGTEAAEGEHAEIYLNKHIKVAYLRQDPSFKGKHTVREVIYAKDHPKIKAITQYESALQKGDEKAIQESLAKMDELQAWDMEARIKEILYKLHLQDYDQPIDIMSGGQLKRLALASIILDEPDFLILDEPTNHLDVEMIEWLEKYLQTASLTLFMVTHDRYFLERVCTEMIELDKGKIFSYKGNYSQYLEKKAQRSHQEAQYIQKSKKLLAKELEWVRRQPKARGTKAKSRVDAFHVLDEQVSSIQYEQVFEINIETKRLGKKIVEFYDASKAFDEKVIIQNFWYKFKKGERVGISGPNGSGKSTFIKIITGEESLDTGRHVVGETVVFGHYRQDGINLDKDKRVIDYLRDIAEYIPLANGQKLSASRLLETFLFTPEKQQVYISQLSGGERKRLHLLTVLIRNPNFLILDEPTNDLDLLTLNVLEDYLIQFPGCLVIISHDRFFMDKLVQHMFIFKGDGDIHDYNGTYSEWRDSSAFDNKKNTTPAVIEPTTTVAPQESEPKAPARKLSYKEKMEIKKIEKRIDEISARQKEISELFMSGNIDNTTIAQLTQESSLLQKEQEEIEDRWLELSEIEG